MKNSGLKGAIVAVAHLLILAQVAPAQEAEPPPERQAPDTSAHVAPLLRYPFVWHFGDGSPPDTTQSNTDQSYHPGVNAGGYATVTHRFEKPGHYIVTVRRSNRFGTATTHLHVSGGRGRVVLCQT